MRLTGSNSCFLSSLSVAGSKGAGAQWSCIPQEEWERKRNAERLGVGRVSVSVLPPAASLTHPLQALELEQKLR